MCRFPYQAVGSLIKVQALLSRCRLPDQGAAHLYQGVHQRVQQGDDVVPEVPSLCLWEQRAQSGPGRALGWAEQPQSPQRVLGSVSEPGNSSWLRGGSLGQGGVWDPSAGF